MRYWLDTCARHNVRAKTLEDYERTIRVHIIPVLGAVPVQKLTPDQLQSFYSDKLAAGCGPRTVQLCHLRLTQALRMALEMGLVVRNAAEAVRAPRVPGRDMQTWDMAQIQRFLAAAAQSPYGPIWAVLLTTGLRREEALGLRWRDVDFERRVLRVRQTVTVVGGAARIGPPKSRSSVRDIQGISPHLLAALREHKARQAQERLLLGPAWHDYDLVFPTGVSTPINPNNLTRDYDRWVAQAGVPRIRIHDQRHVTSRQHVEAGDRIGAALFGSAASEAL